MDCNYNEDVCLCVTFIKKKIEHIDHKVLKLKMHVHVGGEGVTRREEISCLKVKETEAICSEKLTNVHFCLSDRH